MLDAIAKVSAAAHVYTSQLTRARARIRALSARVTTASRYYSSKNVLEIFICMHVHMRPWAPRGRHLPLESEHV